MTQLNRLSLTASPLSQSRQLLADGQQADWAVGDEAVCKKVLGSETYITQSTTDAVLTQTDACGHQQRLAYDIAGQLKGSWLTINQQPEQIIVKSLSYSAAGQKLREEHGNGIITEYQYEPATQRLMGIITRRPANAKSGASVLQDLRYTYDPVGNVVTLRNDAEATRFWRNQKVVPENTYTYDTRYQLIHTTGYEMANRGQQTSQHPSSITPLPADNSAYTNYTRHYTYDRGGNLTHIHHHAPASNNSYTSEMQVSDRSNRAVVKHDGLTAGDVDALFDAGGH